MSTQDYFENLESEIKKAYELAVSARKKGLDPAPDVEMVLAKNMAEKVEGLVSAVVPQIINSGMSERINELEEELGRLDWRVAFSIALEVAQEKFCSFSDQREAIEAGIRVGLSYITLGVIAAPLDGFVKLELKDRSDGKKYMCLYYSGPIRSAGGTGASVSVLIAEYLRKNFGFAKYDITQSEIKRSVIEIYDYHEKVTNLQYLPSEQEIEFLVSNLTMQIDGDPSEKFEVSNYKDLPRISANRIRNGFCLVIAECLCQKAQKLLSTLSKYKGSQFELSDWGFLEGFVRLQKKIKAKERIAEAEDSSEIRPDFTFIKDLVAGRPILTHPMHKGGFRLRYGRARNSGLSCTCIHPATMVVLNDFIAIGTQLKLERPGKGTALNACDTIEGPIVKLRNGDVVFLEDLKDAKKVLGEIKEILFLGDILISYGDFLNRAHVLVPSGYCEEMWFLEIKEKASLEEIKKIFGIDLTLMYLRDGMLYLDFDLTFGVSKRFGVPMYPRYTYHFSDVGVGDLAGIAEWISVALIKKEEDFSIVLPYGEAYVDKKRLLEVLGIPHKNILGEHIVISGDFAKGLAVSFGFYEKKFNLSEVLYKIKEIKNPLEAINKISELLIRDKSGTYIGARMGRPEKAKQRKLTGSPHALFPVGEEGGRLRSFQSAFSGGKIKGDFPNYFCENCKKSSIYGICHVCGKKTRQMFYCEKCERTYETNKCKMHGELQTYSNYTINVLDYMENAKRILGLEEIPDLVKGVRGTSNKDHVVEHLVKGILRAMHNLCVNKDGTIRYDMTELSITHFRPSDIGTSIKKLKELGYLHDIFGRELDRQDQILELSVQDLILPASVESSEEGADVVLVRSANFIDDLLESLYGLERFYHIKTKEDLIGHLLIGIAPHTSAGIVSRIIGFSNTQGCLAHPMWHCAIRRDCFSYDTNIPLFIDGKWTNVRIGDYVEDLNPKQVVDSFGTKAMDVNNVYTLAYNDTTNRIDIMPVKWFTKHSKNTLVKMYLENGREIKTTLNHKFYVKNNNLSIKVADDIKKGDRLVVPYNFDITETNLSSLSLERIYSNREYVMVRNVREFINKKIEVLGKNNFCNIFSLDKNSLYNYLNRDSFPISLIDRVLKYCGDDFEDLPKNRKISIKRNNIRFPYKIPFNKDFLEILGFYIAEGYSRKKLQDKGFYQVDFAICEDQLRKRIKLKIYKLFGLLPSKTKEKRLTYSSRLLYELFVDVLGCGKNAHEKRIPSLLFNFPKDKIRYLLMGYFEGDGSVSKSELRVTCDTVSSGLIYDLEFVLARFGIYLRKYKSKREPGRTLKEFYIRKNKKIPKFGSTKLTVPGRFVKQFYDNINFVSYKKRRILKFVVKNINYRNSSISCDESNVYLKVIKKEILNNQVTYCLNVPGHHNVIANGIVSKQCDGDEGAVMLLLDGLINFSRKFLSAHRGSTQDAPIVLTTKLIASEVDDQVFDMDIVFNYPLLFYEATKEHKMPSEVKIERVANRLLKDNPYSGFGFTHDTTNINIGVLHSAYKAIPTMLEKVRGQMELAEKIRAVDTSDVARLIIERHFIRDIKGNLRKFSTQQFRCSKCNEKYRRPPLIGRCLKCDGKLIFTVSEGSIIKYLEPSLELASKYMLPAYLLQTLELTKNRIDSLFGVRAEKQEGLVKWF